MSVKQSSSAVPIERADGLPSVTVVIPALNEQKNIAACLRALANHKTQADEILVIDNGCTDQTVQIVAGFVGVRVISEPRKGITYARQRGFDEARGHIIARIDADSVVRNDWLDRIRDAFADDSVDAIGGTAAIAELSPGRLFWFRWWYRGFRMWHQRSIGVTPMLYGHNCALRRTAWLRARMLVEMGDNEVSEDVDVTIALLRTGHNLKFVPDLVVKARLFRSIDKEKLSRYYQTDSLTLARHRYGNRKRWAPAQHCEAVSRELGLPPT